MNYPRLTGINNELDLHLSSRVVTAGSAPSCGIQLLLPAPQRVAHILFVGGRYTLQRLDRQYPIRVNGANIDEIAVELSHGDGIVLGTAEYLFRLFEENTSEKKITGSAGAPIDELIHVIIALLRDRDRNVFGDLVASVSRLLKCDAARLLQESAEDGDAQTIARFPESASIGRFSRRAIGWARKSEAAVLMMDTEWNETSGTANSLEQNQVGSILCMPLKHTGETTGFLYLDRLKDSPPFSEGDRMFCEALRPLFEEILANWNERQRQKKTIEQLQQADLSSGRRIIYASQTMDHVMKLAERVAAAGTPVYIQGETGTGKELMARFIHERSSRSQEKFTAVNCGAIPENLIESELFGHEKGAFTGAHQRKIGLFESTHGGTLFLDEISDLPLALQVKLLRVLQESEFTRVGGVDPIKSDVRILSATNRDLTLEVSEGRFREDLFFRLNVIRIGLPPLRERGSDALMIGDYFLTRYCQQFGMAKKQLDAAARKYILGHAWKGNIRELDNIIQKAVLLVEGERIGAADLESDNILGGENARTGHTLKSVRTEAERRIIESTLEKWNGNVSQTAKALDIDRTWLMKLMKEYGIEPAGFRGKPAA